MGYMKWLFTELQEKGMSAEEIGKIPNEVAWKMAEDLKKEEAMKEMECWETRNHLKKCIHCRNFVLDNHSEETLCGRPHDGGDNRPEVCGECMAIKHNI